MKSPRNDYTHLTPLSEPHHATKLISMYKTLLYLFVKPMSQGPSKAKDRLRCQNQFLAGKKFCIFVSYWVFRGRIDL